MKVITENREAYESFQNGTLFLSITAGDLPYRASVTRTQEYDIFSIEQTEEDAQLQALSLAAQQLRIPLSNLMTVIDNLLLSLKSKDAETQIQIGQVNRNLFRILRIISNMSDADNYRKKISGDKQVLNFKSLFSEIIERAQTTTDYTQKKLVYTGLKSAVFGLGDREKLSRAIYNILSNALKFSPADSIVEVRLTQNENTNACG